MASLNEAFRALADHRRRELLLAVRETRGSIEAVSVPEEIIDGEARAVRAAIQYHHVHLPKLEDSGYVHWDRRRDEVSPGPRFEELLPLLEFVEEHQGQRESTTA